MILDPESDGEAVLTFVGELLSKLDQLQTKAFTYKNYQKNFKVIRKFPLLLTVTTGTVCQSYMSTLQVEVTRFEDLEETHAEVKLKQTLWQSQKEWAQDCETWTNVSITYIIL